MKCSTELKWFMHNEQMTQKRFATNRGGSTRISYFLKKG